MGGYKASHFFLIFVSIKVLKKLLLHYWQLKNEKGN